MGAYPPTAFAFFGGMCVVAGEIDNNYKTYLTTIVKHVILVLREEATKGQLGSKFIEKSINQVGQYCLPVGLEEAGR